METERASESRDAFDVNLSAYEAAVEHGDFEGIDPETWLAYSAGTLIDSDLDRDILVDRVYIRPNVKDEIMVVQVKGPEHRKFRGFFYDAAGKLHRGYPITVEDEEGNESVMGLELNTRKVFPLPEKEDQQS